jgi:hypothetical protein
MTVTFRTVSPPNTDRCGICLSSSKKDKDWKGHQVSTRRTLWHSFHTRCISNAFNVSSKCPTCRAPGKIEYSLKERAVSIVSNNKWTILLAGALLTGSVYFYRHSQHASKVVSCLKRQYAFRYEDLQELPPSLRNCSNYLPSLSLSGQALKTLPEWIGEFEQLEELNANRNKLSDLPDTIGNLHKLKTLWLQENQLSKIPDALRFCTNLEVLGMSDNKIEEIPSWICELPRLRKLYLWGNRITEVPQELMHCKKLKVLGLFKNPISKYPRWLKDMGIPELLIGDSPVFSES